MRVWGGLGSATAPELASRSAGRGAAVLRLWATALRTLLKDVGPLDELSDQLSVLHRSWAAANC